MTSYRPDHDLGWEGSNGMCMECGTRLRGPTVLYAMGDPGVEELRAECPKCGARHRWYEETEYGEPIDWVSRNRGWAVSDYRGEPDGFVACIRAFNPDGMVACYLESDGTLTYGEDGEGARFLPPSVRDEVDRRLMILGKASSLSMRSADVHRTKGVRNRGTPSGQRGRTYRRVSERKNARGSRRG